MIPSHTVERFWSHVDRSGGPDACWPWKAGCDKDGYGKYGFRDDGRGGGGRAAPTRHMRSHRVAFELTNGRAPVGLALHDCDNPPCCNPAHLKDGTQKMNREDCATRGRTARGSTHPAASTNEAQVTEIRARLAAGERQADLARAFGMKACAMSDIARGKTWKHMLPTGAEEHVGGCS